MSEGILTALIGAFATITSAIAATVIGIWLRDREQAERRKREKVEKARREKAERQRAEQQKREAETRRQEEERKKLDQEEAERRRQQQGEEERQRSEAEQRTKSQLQQDMQEALEEMRTRGDAQPYYKRQGPSRMPVWQAAAEQDHPIAQWLLACCLEAGIGCKKQIKAAVGWLRKAAEKGLPAAQNSLGDCYYLGEGMKANASEAFRLYTKAAEQGLTEAQINLGDCYYEGMGVKQDFAEATRYYRKAAEAGWARGQSSLGDCFFNGEGVEQNYSQAIAWYRMAAEQGESGGQVSLAYCYEHGKGVKVDLEEAAKWYRKAADEEDVDAQIALGYCYEHGRGVRQDIEKAKHWYRKAADQEHSRAVNALDRLLNAKPPPPEPRYENKQRYWVIAPYSAEPAELWQQVWQYDLANSMISIGWTELDDISSLDEQRLRAAIDRTYSDEKPVARGQYFAMLWNFYHKIKVGDVIIARHGTKKLAGVGAVIRTAYFDPKKTLSGVGDWLEFGNHLDVQWHDSPRDIPFDSPIFSMQTVYQIPEKKLRDLAKKNDRLTALLDSLSPARLTVYGPAHRSFHRKGMNMDRKTQLQTFIEQVKQQLLCLKDEEYGYSMLHVYVAGVPEAWEFNAVDEFEIQEEAGVLIVRDGPTDKDNNDNAEVPEYVFRLDAITATQLA